MRIVRRFSSLVGIVGLVGVVLMSQAALAATVANGSFETGDFTGWTMTPQAQSAGEWTVNTGTSSPDSQHEIPGPSCATHQAVYDQQDESSAVLYQDLTLEAGETHTLTFTHWYQNFAMEEPADVSGLVHAHVDSPPVWGSPDTLDFQYDGVNQQYRVDIMKPSAEPTSVDPADILQTVFQTQDSSPATLDPTPVSVDLSAYAGQTVRLRFAAVDNESFLLVGVDCVSLTSTPIATSSTTSTTVAPTTTAAAAKAVTATPAFTG